MECLLLLGIAVCIFWENVPFKSCILYSSHEKKVAYNDKQTAINRVYSFYLNGGSFKTYTVFTRKVLKQLTQNSSYQLEL